MLDVYEGRKEAFPNDAGETLLPGEWPAADNGGHSLGPRWDLYVVYEGTNPDTGQPIIKAFLNPLVGWIWAGLAVMVLGTFIALVPSLTPATAALRVPTARTVAAEPVLKGGD